MDKRYIQLVVVERVQPLFCWKFYVKHRGQISPVYHKFAAVTFYSLARPTVDLVLITWPLLSFNCSKHIGASPKVVILSVL